MTKHKRRRKIKAKINENGDTKVHCGKLPSHVRKMIKNGANKDDVLKELTKNMKLKIVDKDGTIKEICGDNCMPYISDIEIGDTKL